MTAEEQAWVEIQKAIKHFLDGVIFQMENA